MSIIQIKNLDKSFKGKTVLYQLNIHIKDSGIHCLVGQSGCGKSTLLRIILGLEKQDKGEILINKQTTNHYTTRNISYVDQNNTLFPRQTVRQNIAQALPKRRITTAKQENNIQRILHQIDMKDCQDLYPHQLSGGMKQRVCIARALVQNSKIICMDEPFSKLDWFNRKKLQKNLRHIVNEYNKTVLFVTHDLEEALQIGKQVYGLHKGRIEHVTQGLHGNKEQSPSNIAESLIEKKEKLLQYIAPTE